MSTLGERLEGLVARITDCLAKGGLFNMEVMEAGKVRDLLIDCRTALAAALVAEGQGGVAPLSAERAGQIMHQSWCRTKHKQGFHHPNDCPVRTNVERVKDLKPLHELCKWCHFDLVRWEVLPEEQKDINRHAFDALMAELSAAAPSLHKRPWAKLAAEIIVKQIKDDLEFTIDRSSDIYRADFEKIIMDCASAALHKEGAGGALLSEFSETNLPVTITSGAVPGIGPPSWHEYSQQHECEVAGGDIERLTDEERDKLTQRGLRHSPPDLLNVIERILQRHVRQARRESASPAGRAEQEKR